MADRHRQSRISDGKNKMAVVDLAGNSYQYISGANPHQHADLLESDFLFDRRAGSSAGAKTLAPIAADLHYRGFSRLFRQGPNSPRWFDYAEFTQEPKWRDLEGDYTRYGDVLTLLSESDDKYVIMNAGDEISINFDAAQLAAPPAGWRRDFLIYSDGWLKDGDLNTAHGKTVAPLPFHGMSRYPYGEDESYPRDEAHQEYLRTYNTRKVSQEKFKTLLLNHQRN
jgi:hypothetical protein